MADPEGVRSKSTQAAYTVKIRGEAFELSEEQIRFDSPNYFVSAFFGDWAESTMKEVKLLDRSPKLFRTYSDARKLTTRWLNLVLRRVYTGLPLRLYAPVR